MNKEIYVLLAILVAYAHGQSIIIEDMSPYCTLVADYVLLRNPANQNAYFECKGGVATEKTCQTDYLFNKDTQSCIIAGDAACAGQTETWVSGLDCAYIYCLDGKSKGSGYCPKNQYFNGEACVFGDCPYSSGVVGEMQISSMCDLMPLGKFFGDANDCSNWYRCLATGLDANRCPQTQIFDVSSSTCFFDTTDDYCQRIGTSVLFPGGDGGSGNGGDNSVRCTLAGFMADTNQCSRYYNCVEDKTDPAVFTIQSSLTCPEGQYVTAASGSNIVCTPRLEANPVSATCDRCEASNLSFVTVMGTDCQDYVRCENNRTVPNSQASCKLDSRDIYFNELSIACFVGDVATYPLRQFLCPTS